MDEVVRKDLFESKMESVEKEIQDLSDRSEKRLDAHSKALDDIQGLNIRMACNLEQITKLIEKQTTRIEELEKIVAGITKKAKEEEECKRKRWYEIPIVTFLIKSAIVLVFITLGAAIGVNMLDISQKVLP